MATTEQIIVEYIAQVEGMKAQLKTVETSLKNVEKQGKESAQNTSKEFQKAGASIKEGAKDIATALGLAFGVHQVISFGKESVKAFLEAEVNANKLRFAVTKIGGEGEAAFRKLIEQSGKLQENSIFSDDSIQNAQTMLLTLGLNSKQVEELIPKISDLASATGQDLGSATQQVIQGINGQTRGLKAVGLGFDATTDKTKNLSIITEKLGKFQGASADALETTAGKAKRLENAIDDVKESIGELIVNEGNQILDFFEVLGGGFDKTFNKLGVQALKETITESNKLSIEEAEKSEANRLRLISESNARQIGFAQAVLKAQTDIERNRAKILLDSEIKLQEDLRNLNKSKGGGLGVDQDAIDRAKKAAEDARKLREETLNALKDLDIKADAERLLETAKTESEKLEILRGAAIQEVRLAEQTALEKGNKKADTEIIAQNAIVNINKNFDEQQAQLAREANEKEFQEAIEHADKLGQAEAEAVEKWQKKRIEDEKRAQQAIEKIREESLNKFSSILGSIGQISSNATEQRIKEANEEANEQIAILDKQLSNKEISENEYTIKKAAIEKERDEESKKFAEANFERQKQIQLIGATIDVARGFVGALAQTGELGYAAFVLAALVAAAGAAEIAAIASQPSPTFGKGGIVGGKLHTQGGTMVEAEKDEWIINRRESIKNNDLLKAINSGKGDKYINENYIAPALLAQSKKYEEKRGRSLADNIASSMLLNSSKFNDKNLLESLKILRRNDRDNTEQIIKAIKGTTLNARKF